MNKTKLKEAQSKYCRDALERSTLQCEIINKLYGNFACGILFNTLNGIFITNLPEVELSRKMGASGQYDIEKISFINQWISPEMTVYILGAHIGCLVVPIARSVKKLIAFEPNPEAYFLLDMNLKLNEVRNVTAFNLGTSKSNCVSQFYQNKVNSGGSKILPIIDEEMYHYDNPKIINVNLINLDLFIKINKFEYPDLLIMDIEGSEYDTLLGAEHTLSKARLLYIELVPHHIINVAGVTLADFVSVILKYYSKMYVVDDKTFLCTKEQILMTLKSFFETEICCDLLFLK